MRYARVDRMYQQTWRIIVLLLRCEAIEMDAPTTALCYAMNNTQDCCERTIDSALELNPQ
jgi:hypothetical protein